MSQFGLGWWSAGWSRLKYPNNYWDWKYWHWIANMDIHYSKRVNPNDFGELLTSPVSPSRIWHCCFVVKCFENYWMDYHEIRDADMNGPQSMFAVMFVFCVKNKCFACAFIHPDLHNCSFFCTIQIFCHSMLRQWIGFKHSLFKAGKTAVIDSGELTASLFTLQTAPFIDG